MDGTCSLIRCDGKPEEFLKVNIDEPEVKGLSDAKLEAIRLAANSLKMADSDENLRHLQRR